MPRAHLKPALLAATLLAQPAHAADLALRRVMLSAAGIGYFEYAAQVDGPATLGLDIPLAQVDDVLRSLAIFDDQGGVGSIELPGRDNTSAAFAGVPFAQALLDSPAALLASLRGEEVTVDGPDTMTGRIVSTATEALATPPGAGADHPPATHTRVTLLTEDGFRSFILEDADSVQPTDPGLRARIAAALDAARQQTAASLRHLTLHGGAPGTEQGPRTLSAGYVVAAPLWKASYRLILPPAGSDQARVQGWAVLENQSGQDWKGVDLTLHSGNPVTFHQAIYASYYADRPEVPVEVLGRILPDPDSGGALLSMDASPLIPTAKGPREPGFRRKAPPADFIPPPQTTAMMPAPAMAALASPATPTETAETALDTIFHIATPIDLAAGHTASVPILDQTMKAEPLDWLQPDATRPVSAIRLTNDSPASLPPGVLTLYATDPKTEGGGGRAFAGDARLSGLPAGETRLLGFAEDLRMHIARTMQAEPQTILRITTAHGILHRTTSNRMTYGLDLTAPPHEPRRVLIEFAKQPESTFTLEDTPDAAREATATAWRVTISLKPGETRHLHAHIDTTETTEFVLLNDGEIQDPALAAIATDGTLDAAALAKMQPVLALRDALAAKQAALRHITAEQTQAAADEDRIRNNLRVVSGPGLLHDKLLAALDADETHLAASRAESTTAQAAVNQAEAALTNAIEAL